MRSENRIIRCFVAAHSSMLSFLYVRSHRHVKRRWERSRSINRGKNFFLQLSSNLVWFETSGRKEGRGGETRDAFFTIDFSITHGPVWKIGSGGKDYATLRSRHLLRWGIFFSPCRVTIRVRVIQRNFGLAYSRLWIPCVSGEHVRGRRDAISSVGVAGASFGLSLCRFIFDLAARSQGRIAPSAFPVFEKHSPLSLYLFTQWTSTFGDIYRLWIFFFSNPYSLSPLCIIYYHLWCKCRRFGRRFFFFLPSLLSFFFKRKIV